jgi:hypothetical protein
MLRTVVKDETRIGDNAATGFEQYRDAIQKMFGIGLARRRARDAKGCGQHFRGFETRAEHVAFVCRELVGLRAVAQIIDRDAAAEIDMFERVSRL